MHSLVKEINKLLYLTFLQEKITKATFKTNNVNKYNSVMSTPGSTSI